jgi:hypothetical protein
MTRLRQTAYAAAAVAALASISTASISTQCPAETFGAHGPPTENVHVTNTPLPTRDVDNAARQPIQTQGGQGIGQFTGLPLVIYTVPPGKRLVVEHFSSEMGTATGTAVDRYILAASDPAQPGSATFVHFIPPAYHAPCGLCVAGSELWVASQPIRMYVDGGKALVAGVTLSASAGANTFVFYSVSGYLVDVP